MSEYVMISNEEKYYRIGLNIAYQRKLKKLTQIQLAEKIGISRTHMSNIEAPNMLTPISLEVVFNIADALKIPVDILFKFD
ncbi:helix-turn-helix domain-containing protein [uncultured Ruminococcus sp.]|uniref:helix-turn-helix domain-containing protein n=1 Tax=uncultured Ruminococcus sp. TaxID=165186 RepID=UPI00265F775E|nr:helix-turn-helix transcriptional regulator [uncultured Ruminococcus sp.]